MKNVAFGSDFHIDVTQQNIVEEVKIYLKESNVDIFCFAGDMSASIDLSVETLKSIEDDLGIKVLAVTGNHEVWDTKNGNSFDAINRFNSEIPNISVMAQPYEFSDWVILGNMGWYDYSTALPYYNQKQLDKMQHRGSSWNDKHYCNWNGKLNHEVANYFTHELKNQLEIYKNKKIILMSHIVPYSECISIKNDSSWDYFNAFIGNTNIGFLADSYKVSIAHFGHTHYRYHKRSEAGVEMICTPLGYYGEWTTEDRCIKEELKKCIPIYEL